MTKELELKFPPRDSVELRYEDNTLAYTISLSHGLVNINDGEDSIHVYPRELHFIVKAVEALQNGQ